MILQDRSGRKTLKRLGGPSVGQITQRSWVLIRSGHSTESATKKTCREKSLHPSAGKRTNRAMGFDRLKCCWWMLMLLFLPGLAPSPAVAAESNARPKLYDTAADGN